MKSVGDMARTFVLLNNQVRLRGEMDELAIEVATGFVRDPARHLGGDVTSLMEIDRSLAKLETYRINVAEADFLTIAMQGTLDEVQSRSEDLSSTLIAADLTPGSTLLKVMSNDAENALGQIVNGLNRSIGGRFLFSGVATDRPALPDAQTFLDEALNALSGVTSLADMETALDGFFAPGGSFETIIYEGSNTGLSPLQLSETESVAVDIRASDDTFRQLFKPLIIAALATDPALALDGNVQVEALGQAGRALLGAQSTMADLRAGLGALEARIEETSVRNATERTATSLARLDLVGADQYETATRYENIRSQLESLYAITARTQRMSFAEYM